MFLLEYTEHVLVAAVIYVGGTLFTTIGIGELVALEQFDAVVEMSQLLPREPIDVREACTELLQAAEMLDLYWPRVDDPDVVPNRRLLRRRVTPWADESPDFVPVAAQERKQVLAAFLAGRDPEDGYLAGVAFDFGAGKLRQPLLWGPDAVTCFLLDYVPRKVVLDQRDRKAIVPLVRDWLTFTHERVGLAEDARAKVHEVLDEIAPEFRGGSPAATAGEARAQNASALARELGASRNRSS